MVVKRLAQLKVSYNVLYLSYKLDTFTDVFGLVFSKILNKHEF